MVSRIFSILFLFICSYFFAINSSYASPFGYVHQEDVYLDMTFNQALEAKYASKPPFTLRYVNIDAPLGHQNTGPYYQNTQMYSNSMANSSDSNLLKMFGLSPNDKNMQNIMKSLNSGDPFKAIGSVMNACMQSIDTFTNFAHSTNNPSITNID